MKSRHRGDSHLQSIAIFLSLTKKQHTRGSHHRPELHDKQPISLPNNLAMPAAEWEPIEMADAVIQPQPQPFFPHKNLPAEKELKENSISERRAGRGSSVPSCNNDPLERRCPTRFNANQAFLVPPSRNRQAEAGIPGGHFPKGRPKDEKRVSLALDKDSHPGLLLRHSGSVGLHTGRSLKLVFNLQPSGVFVHFHRPISVLSTDAAPAQITTAFTATSISATAATTAHAAATTFGCRALRCFLGPDLDRRFFQRLVENIET